MLPVCSAVHARQSMVAFCVFAFLSVPVFVVAVLFAIVVLFVVVTVIVVGDCGCGCWCLWLQVWP